MRNRSISNEHGFTLLELLLTLVISTIILGVVFGVFSSSIKFNKQTQSHVNLRQEANLIITQLRQLHQGGDYSLCYNDLLPSGEIYFSEITLDNGGVIVDASNPCGVISPLVDLSVDFTVTNENNQEFEVDTVIEYRRGDANVTIELPNLRSFYDFLVNENVFVYGSSFDINNNSVTGTNATMVLTGDLDAGIITGAPLVNVSTIYVKGNLDLSEGKGAAGALDIGSPAHPRNIFVAGDAILGNGNRGVYGNLYVNGDFTYKNSPIEGNVYVKGNVTLEGSPNKVSGKIYHEGTVNSEKNNINFAKIERKSQVESFTPLAYDIPPLKPVEWYHLNGYTPGGSLENNSKIFVSDYSTSISNKDNFTNIIVVSKNDINITGKGKTTGVLFAPYGKVEIDGDFEGVIIARDGFISNGGGKSTHIIFKNISEYISSMEDAPF
ncbi:prepilin-type N-terminal cleavage/methylation domain-containing protein [Cytobacillus suaedae]|nr:prepilin-type N-terminal cleavage/methylation domain-containing protein [Cytobacillus suaedae]